MSGRRQRWVLSILAIIFLAPLLLARAVYHQPSWQPDSGLQHGELLDQTQLALSPVPADLLHGHWTLLYRNEGPCEQSCHELLATLHRVRLAQDRAMRRVQRILVAPQAIAQSDSEPDLRIVTAANGSLPAGQVYLVDPRGVPVLRYQPGFDPRGLIKDLQRLLRLAGEG